jgi:hypothetical protein
LSFGKLSMIDNELLFNGISFCVVQIQKELKLERRKRLSKAAVEVARFTDEMFRSNPQLSFLPIRKLGTDVMIFKIFSPKKFSKNIGVFYSKQS